MELTNSVSAKYFKPDFQWLYTVVHDHFTDPKFKEIPSKNVVEEYLNKHFTDPKAISEKLDLYQEISDKEIDIKEFTWHLDKFKKRYNSQLQRECLKKAVKTIQDDSEDEDETLDEVNRTLREAVISIDNIYRRESYEEGSLDESAKARLEQYKVIEADPTAAQGVLTGFTEFDRITNGLHKGEFMIVSGATGTGKSVVMHNMGVNAYLNKNNPINGVECIERPGHNILYFSLEMPKSTMERRIDSCMGDLYYKQIRDGMLDSEAKKRYFQTLKFQAQYDKKFHIIDMPKGATTREIEIKYLEVAENKFEPDLVIIDYIGIMSPNDPGDADWLALGHISAELHEFARVYNLPVITGSQVNRPKDPGKQNYSTDRLARSDMVTNNANIIIQIGCREDEYLRTDMEIYITKMRDGEKGSFLLSKNFQKMKVIDMFDDSYTDEDDEDVGI